MSINWKCLYVEWLEEACESAGSRPNAKYLAQAYQKSLQSIASCPLEDFTEVHQIKSLKFVGDKTVAMLLKKTAAHCKQLGVEVPEGLRLDPPVLAPQSVSTKTTSNRKYIPRYGTTAYHILLTIREFELQEYEDNGIGRKDLLRLMKPRLMLSLEGNKGKQIPNLAPAFAVLTKKGLIYYRNTKYFLEETGRTVADGLLKVQREQNGLPVDDLQPPRPSSVSRTVQDLNTYQYETWSSSDYSIKLLLDNREVASRDNRTGFADALAERNVNLEISALAVGDAMWVAEHKSTGKMAALDYILERKNLRDLVQSIMDGRFFEQKTRLQRSQISNVIYLIEMVAGPDMASHEQRIRTAMSQIIALRGFFLKQAASQNDTVLYLSQMTEEISKKYSGTDLKVVLPQMESYETSIKLARSELGKEALAIDFGAFQEGLSKSKSQTINQLFLSMLMTIKGVSAEKAQVIMRMYPTPLDLVHAYNEGNEEEKKSLLYRQTLNNIPRRRIRQDISEMVFNVWGKQMDVNKE